MPQSVKNEVISSTFDEPAKKGIVAEATPQTGRGIGDADVPAGNPLGAPTTAMTQGYGVGSHAPANIWVAVDLAIDGDGDRQAVRLVHGADLDTPGRRFVLAGDWHARGFACGQKRGILVWVTCDAGFCYAKKRKQSNPKDRGWRAVPRNRLVQRRDA